MVTRAKLTKAIAAGDLVGTLRASLLEMERRFRNADTSDSAMAALGREIRMTAEALAAAEAYQPVGDDLDELAARREARLSG